MKCLIYHTDVLSFIVVSILYRREGQDTQEELERRDLKEELEERERRHFSSKDKGYNGNFTLLLFYF